MALTLSILLILSLSSAIHAHFRLAFPPARSPNPGLKSYPCGGIPWMSTQAITDLVPGPLTLKWQETISHSGAPFRIAIGPSDDSSYDKYILYDHIPHNDVPVLGTKFYSFTMNVPDVHCINCTLQIVNPMTDKLPPESPCCTFPEEEGPPGTIFCFSVYHSCSNVNIRGRIPLSEWTNTYATPCGPYNHNIASWTLLPGSQTDYALTNPNYVPGLDNTCPLWERNCTSRPEPQPKASAISSIINWIKSVLW